MIKYLFPLLLMMGHGMINAQTRAWDSVKLEKAQKRVIQLFNMYNPEWDSVTKKAFHRLDSALVKEMHEAFDVGMSHLKDTTTGTGSLRLGRRLVSDSNMRPPVQGIKVPLEARVYSLERRVAYLTKETIELRRKMDSLLLERRQPRGPFYMDSTTLKRIIEAKGIGYYRWADSLPTMGRSKPHP